MSIELLLAKLALAISVVIGLNALGIIHLS